MILQKRIMGEMEHVQRGPVQKQKEDVSSPWNERIRDEGQWKICKEKLE